MAELSPRHIQDHNEPNATLVPYWGYANRVLPCTKDPGTCEYLAAVYKMHTTSMTYTFVLWGVILGILVAWVTIRGWRMGGPAERVGGWVDGVCDSFQRGLRRWLGADAPGSGFWGRVSGLQVAVLVCLLGYLLIFSLVGLTYRTWTTPVEDSPGIFNTRTTLGGWADRIGALAYALTPFAILLSNRESILSLLTGIPYQHFTFLHRWTGRIIFVQSALHTLGWTVVEGRLYQPQPAEYARLMSQMYIIFGVVAMFLLTLMMVLSTGWARGKVGYEVFKITHWMIAVLYIGACWGHWDRLWCWMVPSLVLIVGDQAMRAVRTCYIHLGGSKGRDIGFRCAEAGLRVFGEGEDVVVRLNFDYEHREPWRPGQHFYLCFPSLSIWQSHPFTPASSPEVRCGTQHHTYLIRVRQGQTLQLQALGAGSTLPVILTGPYGNEHPRYETRNFLAIAGGTGVSFTLPVALAALRQAIIPRAAVDFVWVVRQSADLDWLATELTELTELLNNAPSLRLAIFVTREPKRFTLSEGEKSTVDEKMMNVDTTSTGSSSSSASAAKAAQRIQSAAGHSTVTYLGDHHPSMSEILVGFMERAEIVGGNIEVVGSGPEAMGSDLRAAVAAVKTREHLHLYWDSRE